MTVKKIRLNEEIVFGDVQLKIKEITFENKQRKNVDFERMERLQQIIVKIPRSLQQPIYRFYFFYSRPYELTPGQGVLKISGMATSSKELNNDYNPILDNIDFQINGDSSFHGIGRQKSHSSNIVFFNVRNDHFYFDYKKQPFVLTVTDEKTGKDYNIEIKCLC